VVRRHHIRAGRRNFQWQLRARAARAISPIRLGLRVTRFAHGNVAIARTAITTDNDAHPHARTAPPPWCVPVLPLCRAQHRPLNHRPNSGRGMACSAPRSCAGSAPFAAPSPPAGRRRVRPKFRTRKALSRLCIGNGRARTSQ
jgi:hypothetical protein